MKLKIIFCLTILFVFVPNSYSQAKDFDTIEKYVDSVSISSYNDSFEVLACRLAYSEWEAIDKAYAVFYWIASNIDYDSIGYENGIWHNYPSDYKMAFDTYMLKKGVCAGYSYLYKFMCEEIGLKVKTIDGFARTEFQYAGLPINISDHTWNAIYIDSTWKLVDVTWASTTAFNNRINTYYFLTPPEEFVSNHFPENKEDMFTPELISKSCFDKYPYISSEYFELGFNLSFPKEGILKAKNNSVNLSIQNPIDLMLFLRIYDYGLDKWISQDYDVTQDKDKTVFTIRLKNKGNYLLLIDALSQNTQSAGIYKGVLAYTIVND